MAKEQFKKFSKGFLLGTAMMTAVGSGIVATGCSQPAGSSIPYIQPTPTPTPTPTPGPEDDEAEKFGGKPYDATIGNGNYNLHTFTGANTVFVSNDKEKADYYINKAETYVKGLANKLAESTKNRPEAQAYFSEMMSEIQNAHYMGAGPSFDMMIDSVSLGTALIMGDITKNVTDEDQAYDFETSYRVIANESTKAGAGATFTGSDSATRYNKEKNDMLEAANDLNFKTRNIYDLQKSYDNNDFTAVTNFIDQCLTTAAGKIGHGVTADDLRQVVNIAMTTESLGALHANSKVALNHTTHCTLDLGIIKDAIDPTNYTFAMLNRQQDNGRELC